jgi:autotransporter translocation and assembly factor TamB
MRTWTLGTCCIVTLYSVGCGEALFGNGQREQETRNVTGFTKVESAGSVDVAIEYAEDYRLEVSLDSNLIPELETHVVGDTLLIEHHPDFADIVSGPHVRITMPDLRKAELSGSGELTVAQPESAHDLSLDLSGSGRLEFTGSAPKTSVRLSGSGDVVLDGKSPSVQLRLDGSGDIDAHEFAADIGDVNLSGSGTVRAAVAKTANVQLSGSGDIYLYGDARLTRFELDGSGELHRQ